MLEPTAGPDGAAQVPRPLYDTRSARLVLRRPAAGDVHELFAMYSDLRVWSGDPLLRHPEITRTEATVERWARAWHQRGLGPWLLRDLHGPTPGRLIGVGGCSLPSEVAWNLAFTLHPDFWGQGYAQEVAAAGISCARALRPGLPITAVVAERNTRSRRAVERTGLTEVWRGPDRRASDPAAVLLLYADRGLSQAQVHELTA